MHCTTQHGTRIRSRTQLKAAFRCIVRHNVARHITYVHLFALPAARKEGFESEMREGYYELELVHGTILGVCVSKLLTNERQGVYGFCSTYALANAHTHARAQQLLKYVHCLFMHLCARKEYRYCLFLYLCNVRGLYPIQNVVCNSPNISQHPAAHTSSCRF